MASPKSIYAVSFPSGTYHLEPEELIDQHVFGLEVSVHDAVGVDLVQGFHELGSVAPCQLRLERGFDPHEVRQRAEFAMLEHEEELVLVLKFRVQLYYKRFATEFL